MAARDEGNLQGDALNSVMDHLETFQDALHFGKGRLFYADQGGN
jgi:hypothetical protein